LWSRHEFQSGRPLIEWMGAPPPPPPSVGPLVDNAPDARGTGGRCAGKRDVEESRHAFRLPPGWREIRTRGPCAGLTVIKRGIAEAARRK